MQFRLRLKKSLAIARCHGALRSQPDVIVSGGGTLVRPPPRGPPWKPLLRFSVYGILSASSVRRVCDDIRYLYGFTFYSIMILSMLCPSLSLSVCPIVCDGKKERAKCQTSFLLGYTVYSDSVVDADAPQERTLDGGGCKATRYQGLLGWFLRRGRGGPCAPPPRFVNLKVSWFVSCSG